MRSCVIVTMTPTTTSNYMLCTQSCPRRVRRVAAVFACVESVCARFGDLPNYANVRDIKSNVYFHFEHKSVLYITM